MDFDRAEESIAAGRAAVRREEPELRTLVRGLRRHAPSQS
jgi:hypothetical protein